MFLIAAMVVAPGLVAKAPKWFDTRLAGYLLAYDEQRSQAGVFDKQRNYYLVRSVECDGAHVDLFLTRDRKMVASLGYTVPSLGTEGSTKLDEKPLRDLSTGRGVTIGDRSSAVRAKLGAPTKVERTGDRRQFTDFVYFWRDVKNGEGYEWTNRYVFKADRLIEIHFNREAVPGEGD